MNRRRFAQLMAASGLGYALRRGNALTAGSVADVCFSVMLWTLEKTSPFEQCIEVVAAAGYQGIELVGEFHRWSAAETRRVRTRMQSLGLVCDAMSGVTAGFADPGGGSELLSQLSTQIAAAKDLACPKIILLSGKRVEEMSRSDQRRVCIENLKRVADLASKNNTQIVIEPIDPLENPSIYLTSVSEGFELVREVGSPNLKVLYDFYHEQRAYGNLLEKLEHNIEWVGLVHVADVPGRREPGTGEIDFLNIYRKLAELRYDQFIAMEYYPTGDPVASLRAARAAALQAWNTRED
jgi:hydroxypyruvate isomerase